MSSTKFILTELLSLPVHIGDDSDRIYRMTENFFVVYGDTFGKRVRLLRQDRKWSQVDLVQELDKEGVKINNTWISQIENSDRMPSADVAIAMAKVFRTTTDFLFLLVDDPRAPSEDEPEFFSPEADEAARIIDAMPSAEWRMMALGEVKRVGVEYEDTQRLRKEISDGLQRLEESAGPLARAIAEDIFNSRLFRGSRSGRVVVKNLMDDSVEVEA